MQTSDAPSTEINYDFSPVATLEVDEMQYRIDVGMGSAVAVSGRAVGNWSWEFLAAGRWDGVRLKAAGIERLVVAALEQELRAASRASE